MALADGYGIVPGRGREKATRLLAITKDLGLPVESVLTRQNGYEVPLAVLDKYDAELSAADEAIEPEVAEPAPKRARSSSKHKKS